MDGKKTTGVGAVSSHSRVTLQLCLRFCSNLDFHTFLKPPPNVSMEKEWMKQLGSILIPLIFLLYSHFSTYVYLCAVFFRCPHLLHICISSNRSRIKVLSRLSRTHIHVDKETLLCQAVMELAEPGLLGSIIRTENTRVETLILNITLPRVQLSSDLLVFTSKIWEFLSLYFLPDVPPGFIREWNSFTVTGFGRPRAPSVCAACWHIGLAW